MGTYIFFNWRHGILVVLLGIVFFSLLFWGISRGKQQAESGLVLKQTEQLLIALNFFYDNNNRFPTADEYAGGEVMQTYLSRMPQNSDIQSSDCPTVFDYSRAAAENFELSFCLPIAFKNFNSGWNMSGRMSSGN